MLRGNINSVRIFGGLRNSWMQAIRILNGMTEIINEFVDFESDKNSGIKIEISDAYKFLRDDLQIYFIKIANFEAQELNMNEQPNFDFESTTIDDKMREIQMACDRLNDYWQDPQYDEFKDRLKYIFELMQTLVAEDENE